MRLKIASYIINWCKGIKRIRDTAHECYISHKQCYISSICLGPFICLPKLSNWCVNGVSLSSWALTENSSPKNAIPSWNLLQSFHFFLCCYNRVDVIATICITLAEPPTYITTAIYNEYWSLSFSPISCNRKFKFKVV